MNAAVLFYEGCWVLAALETWWNPLSQTCP